jgi:DNA-binding GntR family transcriptional regulator
LRERIADGDLASAEMLPTHAELAEDYDVSDNTIRAVIRELAQEGLVATSGRGGTRIVRGTERTFLVADAKLENLRLIAGLEEARRAAVKSGGLLAEINITEDYRVRRPK